ncbi:unnamed protein product [Calypogeia fissa]
MLAAVEAFRIQYLSAAIPAPDALYTVEVQIRKRLILSTSSQGSRQTASLLTYSVSQDEKRRICFFEVQNRSEQS